MTGFTLDGGRRLHAGHALVALLGGLVVALAVRAATSVPAPVLVPPAAPPPVLTDRALLASADPFFPGGSEAGDALPVTALPFSLHGLRFDSVTGRGSAILAGDDGLQRVREVGDDLGSGVTLAAVALDHVVLDRGGTREALWLDNANSAPVQSYTPPASATPEPPPLQGMPASDPAEGTGTANEAVAAARGDASGDGDGSGDAVVPVARPDAPPRLP
jgi:general secretion pathway protein C